MNISTLARSISESPTLALNEKARILRLKGEPVINMGIGEPKNKDCRLSGAQLKPTMFPYSLKLQIVRFENNNIESFNTDIDKIKQ